MNLGSLRIENISPLTLTGNQVAIKPIVGGDLSLDFNILEYVRNILMSMNGMSFDVIKKTEKNPDYAAFINGMLVGEVDGTKFAVSPVNFDTLSGEILDELAAQLSAQFNGEVKLATDGAAQEIADGLSLKFNPSLGNIELIKQVGALEVKIALSAVYLLPTLIDSYSEKCKSHEDGYSINAAVVVDGLILPASIKSSLTEGKLDFTVQSFLFKTEAEQNPERKAFFEKVDANFTETTFSVDFNQITFDAEYTKQLFSQSAKFLIGNAAAMRKEQQKQQILRAQAQAQTAKAKTATA